MVRERDRDKEKKDDRGEKEKSMMERQCVKDRWRNDRETLMTKIKRARS